MSQVESLLDAAFYSAMAFMLLFGIVQYMPLRDRVELVCTVYLGMAVLYVMQLDGAAVRFLWPGRPQWSEIAAVPLGAAAGVAALLYARAFLKTRQCAPRIDRVLLALAVMTPLCAAGALVVSDDAAEAAAYLLAIAVAAACVAAGGACSRSGRTSARFYVTGAAGAFAAVVIVAMSSMSSGGLGSSARLWLVKGAIVFNALMFATAMADRTRQLRLERDAAIRRTIAAVAKRRETRRRVHAAETSRLEALLFAEDKTRQLSGAGQTLRQPLAALRRALAGMAEERRLSANVLQRLAASLDHLDALARHSLDTSPHGAGVPGGAQETFPIASVLRNIESMFRDAAERKGLVLRCRTSAVAVRGDATTLTRMLSNLVGNAINYTRRGKVLVGCRRRGAALRVMVLDTGPGLETAELRRVMQPHQRGASAEGVEGEGLGLAIVRALAEELGYELQASSRRGRGSAFAIVVPIVPPTPPATDGRAAVRRS